MEQNQDQTVKGDPRSAIQSQRTTSLEQESGVDSGQNATPPGQTLRNVGPDLNKSQHAAASTPFLYAGILVAMAIAAYFIYTSYFR